MYNSNTTDNGDKVKIAAYNESASGGPGTLAKNFGEVTLTGVSAVRTFASSWAANPGWYYLAMVSDNAVECHIMTAMPLNTLVGELTPNMAANMLGVSTPTVGTNHNSAVPSSEYVGGTYANFPESTALTPTTTIFAQTTPVFGLYT